jgi:hypothetical protein
MGHLRILLPNQLAIERLITLRREKRHRITTPTHNHGSPAETKPDSTIRAHSSHSSVFVLQGPFGKKGKPQITQQPLNIKT